MAKSFTPLSHDKTLFSPNERLILKLLAGKKMTITQLTWEFYRNEAQPINAPILVASTIRRINKKCSFYGKSWSIVGRGTGRTGRTVWRETNGKKKA